MVIQLVICYLLCKVINVTQGVRVEMPDSLSSLEVTSRGASYHLNPYINDTNILIMCAYGVDDIELVSVLSILRKAKINTQFASLKRNFATIVLEHEVPIIPDVDMGVAEEEGPYDMVFIPGGEGYIQYMKSKPLENIIRKQYEANRYLAVSSTAPLYLYHIGVGKGKHLTFRRTWTKLLGSVFTVHDIGVVQDGNLVSCQGPATALEFALHIVEIFKGKLVAQEVSEMVSYRRNLSDVLVVNTHEQKPAWMTKYLA